MSGQLYDHLRSFRLLHDAEKCTLLLHTSAVRLSSEELKNLLSLHYEFRLPANVFYELCLLRESVYDHYRKNARLLLSAVPKADFDLEELYDYHGHRPKRLREVIPEGKIVFLFFNTGEMEELVRLLPGEEEIYIINLSGRSRERIDYPHPLQLLKRRLAEAGTLRETTPAEDPDSLAEAADPRTLKEIYVCDHTGDTHLILDGADLSHEERLVGAEATIYTHPKHPGYLLKIFNKAAGDVRYQTVFSFCQNQACFSPDAAVPKEVLLLKDGTLIGFVMPRFSGALLGEVIDTDWQGHDRQQVLRNLILAVLELRVQEINIPDISRRNFMVGADDRVYLLDCDSFEMDTHPVAALTEVYAHPELYETARSCCLRSPHHLNFAFSVLLFQCLSGINNPLQQKRRDPERPLTWMNYKFPYDTDCPMIPARNPQVCFDQWAGLERDLRAGFADEFHLRRTQSLGAWIRRLHLD